MSVPMSWTENIGFIGRKGLKKAETEQKSDYFNISFFVNVKTEHTSLLFPLGSLEVFFVVFFFGGGGGLFVF